MIRAMNVVLTAVEARVLGALIEKDITTPDYYPLSLNALINACNQKSNRDPVMNLDEDVVRDALRGLEDNDLASAASGSDSRVTKYEHHLQESFNFNRLETAVLCELLLRGLQTPGELRSRAERMHRFDDLSEVQSTLQRLIQREPPVVKLLPRQPGAKEPRYCHLLSGDVEPQPHLRLPAERTASVDLVDAERTTHLEKEMADLRTELEDLKRQFADFQKQFQ